MLPNKARLGRIQLIVSDGQSWRRKNLGKGKENPDKKIWVRREMQKFSLGFFVASHTGYSRKPLNYSAVAVKTQMLKLPKNHISISVIAPI